MRVALALQRVVRLGPVDPVRGDAEVGLHRLHAVDRPLAVDAVDRAVVVRRAGSSPAGARSRSRSSPATARSWSTSWSPTPSRSPWSWTSRRRSRRERRRAAERELARGDGRPSRRRSFDSSRPSSSRRIVAPRRRLCRCSGSPSSCSALTFVGAAAAVVPTTVLPRPAFPAPATGPGTNTRHFRIVSSTPIDPAQLVTAPKPTRAEDRRRGRKHAALRLRPELHLRLPQLRTAAAHRAGRERVRLRAGRLGARGPTGVLYVETAPPDLREVVLRPERYLSAIDPKRSEAPLAQPARSSPTRATSSC